MTEADIISCVEFNQDGDLLATGDKGGRVVIFQRDPASKSSLPRRGEYNVYSTFQSHEPEFDYLKSLEIEEKINKIRWLKRKNPAHFLLSTNDKTIKLWKVSERDKRAEGYNLKEDTGVLRDPATINTLRVSRLRSCTTNEPNNSLSAIYRSINYFVTSPAHMLLVANGPVCN